MTLQQNKEYLRQQTYGQRCYTCGSLGHFSRQCEVKRPVNPAPHNPTRLTKASFENPSIATPDDNVLQFTVHDILANSGCCTECGIPLHAVNNVLHPSTLRFNQIVTRIHRCGFTRKKRMDARAQCPDFCWRCVPYAFSIASYNSRQVARACLQTPTVQAPSQTCTSRSYRIKVCNMVFLIC